MDCKEHAAVTTMTIRDLDDELQDRLRLLAARHGRSPEEEARDILRNALAAQAMPEASLLDTIRARIEPLGGIELTLPRREPIRGAQDTDR